MSRLIVASPAVLIGTMVACVQAELRYPRRAATRDRGGTRRMPFSVWARGDSASANNAEINAESTNQTPTTKLTFAALGPTGDEKLEFNGGLPDPDTIVYVNDDTTVPLTFTLEFGGFLKPTNKLRDVAGEDLRGAEVLVLTLSTGDRYFFLRNRTFQSGSQEEADTFTLMEAFPNGAHPLTPGSLYTCFTPGTRILTPTGPLPVETLMPGDKVSCYGGGHAAIQLVTSRNLSSEDIEAFPEAGPILLPRNLLAPGSPQADLVVSPLHRILIENEHFELLFGLSSAFVPARDVPGARRAQVENGTTYIHLLTERHEVVIANGAPAETLLPGDMSMLSLTATERERVAALAIDTRCAFPCLTGREIAVWHAALRGGPGEKRPKRRTAL